SRGEKGAVISAEGQLVPVASQEGLLITMTQRAMREPSGGRRQMVAPISKVWPPERQVQGTGSGRGPRGMGANLLSCAATPPAPIASAETTTAENATTLTMLQHSTIGVACGEPAREAPINFPQ